MIDLEQFKKNAIERGLCQGYTDKWTSEKSNRELFEIACDANGAEFMAASVAEGWGVSPEYFAKKFKAYVNGKYICEYKNDKGHGYTGAMLCEYNDDNFEVSTTLLCILDSNTDLKIKTNHFCKIFIAGDSRIDISIGANSRCFIYVYGGSPLITGDVINSRVIVERIMPGTYIRPNTK